MQENVPTAVVVCGYGCHLVPELTRYLDTVADYINRCEPDALVLCGGLTQQASAPDRTEALVMLEYLEMPGKLRHRPYLFLEDGSFTTSENLRGASIILEHRNVRRLIIFCEATRSLKVSILARHFFGFPPAHGLPPIQIRTVSWELMHPLRELKATIYDALSLYVPGLAWWWGRRRRKKARTQ